MNTTMDVISLKRYDILRSLTRYEDAHKRALKMAMSNSIETATGVEVRIDSPIFEIVRMYKKKIKALRKELKELA